MNFYPCNFGGGISNSKVVTEEGKYALDARQNNPSLPDTLAYDIKRIETEFEEKLKWKFIGMFDLEANVFKDINIPNTANEVWFIVGRKNNAQIYGGVSTVLPNYDNGQHIAFFTDVYDADGTAVARGVYAYYVINTLRVKVKEFLSDKLISVRVYYR